MRLEPINRPLELFGTGFPNRVVSAPVGSIYTDTDATNGAIRWIKTSGTSNTGWEVEYGDTGWRDISGRLMYGWTSSEAILRRKGSEIEVRIKDLNPTEATDRAFFSPSTGYKPGPGGMVVTVSAGGSNSAVVSASISGGDNQVWRLSTTETPPTSSLTAKYSTSESWPLTLPGPVDGLEESPAGSGLYTTTDIVENPADSGLFDTPTSLTPDPDYPGLYLIGD